MTTWRHKGIFIFSAAVFAAAVFAKIHTPILEWDHVYLEAAANWASGFFSVWRCDHPPLYPFYLTLPFRFFGASPETARVFNAFSVLATAYLVFLTAKNLSGGIPGIFAASLYLLNPVTIQGVQSHDSSDTTLLPLSFALIAFAASRGMGSGRRGIYVLSLLLAFSLWAKVTSSLVFITGVLFCCLLWRRRAPEGFCRIVVPGAIGGILLFAATWSAVSLSFWGWESWAYLAAPFMSLVHPALPYGGESFLKIFLNLTRVVLWFSPFLLYLVIVKFTEVFSKGDVRGIIYPLAGVCVVYFTGYAVVGGSNLGYPRYHAAISPLLHVLAGILLGEISGRVATAPLRAFFVSLFLCSGLVIVYIDPEFLINLTLKQLVFAGDYHGVIARVFVPLALYAVFPFAAGVIFNKVSGFKDLKTVMVSAAAAALLGTSLSLAVRQSRAAYSTSTQYGASGKAEVLALVSGRLSGGEAVMATPEFIYALRGKNVKGPAGDVWLAGETIFNFISEKEPRFVIAGWTINTLIQLKYFFLTPKMRSTLEANYVLSEVGTYFVWERRRNISHARPEQKKEPAVGS